MTTPTLREAEFLIRLRTDYAYDPATGVMTQAVTKKGMTKGRVIGSINSRGYLTFKAYGVSHKVHRLAWLHFHGEWPQFEIDHINGIKTDNRIANLRDVPRSLNMQNRKCLMTINKTGFAGVRHYGNRYRAQITINGKARHVGMFATPSEAHQAYLEAKRKHHEGWV
jgi:HNH endonuclease